MCLLGAGVVNSHVFGLVPIMVGHLHSESYVWYAKTLQPLLDDPHTFFVISSDFCHWGTRYTGSFSLSLSLPLHSFILHFSLLSRSFFTLLLRFNYTYYDEEFGAIHESIKHLDTLGILFTHASLSHTH
jgi:hypothetical protein